jgi:apolipoprotein N-acyltransferase
MSGAILQGWKRNGAAFFFGICATLTLAPYYFFPLLIPSFTGLFWLINKAPSRKRMFWDGWWWGWGFYMSGLYWFCIALLTDAEKFAWLIPFALFGLNAVIAIYSGIACWLMGWARVSGLTKLILFSTIWTLVEYARGHLFTGFPWNLPGYSFGAYDITLQLASILGAYGLSFYAVLLGSSFAALAYGKRGAIYLLIVWASFAASLVWGYQRLENAGEAALVPGVKLRLVQANIAQPHKWDPKLEKQGVQEHVRLTQLSGIEQMTHVIWPETAVPYAITPETELPQILGTTIPDGVTLITGGLRTEGEGSPDWKIWNSLVAIDHSGAIVGSYDKTRLVPFGEFLPGRALLPKAWLTPVGDTDFSRGQSVKTLKWPGLPPFLPLICYEVIFPELPSQAENPRPEFMLSVTNDAWFGLSSGPHQHFNMARMRAAEQGIPMVRAANTGISGVIDGYGRVLASLPLGTQGILDTALPKPIEAPTFYSKQHSLLIPALLILALLLTLPRRKSR